MTFRRRARRRRARSVVLGPVVLTALTLPPAFAQPAPDEFALLDHVQGTAVQTNAAPVRPMPIDADHEIWAVNTGLGTVERFRGVNTDPIDTRRVPWGPVSIAEWDDPDGTPELLVVCRNTWGLLRMDKATGRHEGFVRLPAEPSDVVIDAAHQAFVSCTGADAVVRIDLTVRDDAFHEIYDETTTGGELRLKSPYFLNLDVDGTILVTPLHSGNNTAVEGVPLTEVDEVVSLEGRIQGLPDQDLFRIDDAPAQPGADIDLVATGVGSILFAHGRHPDDSRYWILNTEALNADPARQSEPALEGHFVDNRVTILDATTQSVVRFEDDDPEELDSVQVIGQPFALDFHPINGNVHVTGLLTDDVTVLDSSGSPLFEIELPPGSIPRAVLHYPSNPNLIAVYCWGRGTIEVHKVQHANQSASLLGTYDLRPDPIEEDPALFEGRQLFYDGHVSARQNVSCASCHVDAGTDFLTWNLSAAPFDDKGPMVTQTLVGLERVSPFHWRGERTMEDFNTFGVPGLLGAEEPLPEEEFAKMKAWLFALKNPANPFQTDSRRIDPARGFTSVVPPGLEPSHPIVQAAPQVPLAFSGGNAVAGQPRFLNEPFFQDRFACADCHALPVGTNNDVFATALVGTLDVPERSHFVNAPFHELWRKKQSMVIVDFGPAGGAPEPEVRTFLGAGLSHSGSAPDIVRFTQPAIDPEDDPQFLLDVAAYMQQLDQGLAPAAHYARLLPAGPPGGAAHQEIATYLLGQASRTANFDQTPNCDVAVFEATPPRRSWVLRRPPGVVTIDANDPVFVRSLDAGEAVSLDALDGLEPPLLFVGLPVGMGERFGVDFDMDGLPNGGDDAPFAFDPDPDDELPPEVSVSVGYLTTNTARVFVESDEPSTVAIEWFEAGTGERMRVESNLLSRVHSFITAGMRPSTVAAEDPPGVPFEVVSYDADVFADDGNGNPRPTPLSLSPLVPQTGGFTMPPDPMGQPEEGVPFEQLLHEHVLAGPPAVTLSPPSAGVVTGSVDVVAAFKQGPGNPAPGRGFAVRLFRSAGGTAPFVPLDATEITPGGGTMLVRGAVAVWGPGPDNQPLDVDGPLLLNDTPTDPSAAATLAFSLTGLAPGDVILANVEAVVETTMIAESTVGCSNGLCFGLWTVAGPAVYAQWDFPRTTEANLSGSATVPP